MEMDKSVKRELKKLIKKEANDTSTENSSPIESIVESYTMHPICATSNKFENKDWDFNGIIHYGDDAKNVDSDRYKFKKLDKDEMVCAVDKLLTSSYNKMYLKIMIELGEYLYQNMFNDANIFQSEVCLGVAKHIVSEFDKADSLYNSCKDDFDQDSRYFLNYGEDFQMGQLVNQLQIMYRTSFAALNNIDAIYQEHGANCTFESLAETIYTLIFYVLEKYYLLTIYFGGNYTFGLLMSSGWNEFTILTMKENLFNCDISEHCKCDEVSKNILDGLNYMDDDDSHPFKTSNCIKTIFVHKNVSPDKENIVTFIIPNGDMFPKAKLDYAPYGSISQSFKKFSRSLFYGVIAKAIQDSVGFYKDQSDVTIGDMTERRNLIQY
jgi:hypothetical protein